MERNIQNHKPSASYVVTTRATAVCSLEVRTVLKLPQDLRVGFGPFGTICD